MKKIIVFAHMMKTAGTNLNKQLIGAYGPNYIWFRVDLECEMTITEKIS